MDQGEPGVDYNEPNLNPLVCDICRAKFDSLDKLGDHQKVEHDISLARKPMSAQDSLKMVRKSIRQPDETRRFEKGKIDITNVGDTPIGLGTFEPGWKWSTHVKPIVGTSSCEVKHTMYVISGKMHVRMNDGTEQEFGPGDTGIVPSGHDAWVVGNENFVAVDFTAARTYAKK